VAADDDLTTRLAVVRGRIAAAAARAGRDPAAVTLVAVTKGFGPDVVRAAVAAGLHDLGESYAQELAAKADAVLHELRWHFVGRVQRNKVRAVAPLVHLWHAVDRDEVGETIARHAPGAAVLVQVNVTGEPQKGGCRPDDAPGLVARLAAGGLDVRGLMMVGPAGPAEGARAGFRLLAGLAGDLGLPELSMGMSGDLEVAVEEGATILRVGEALFGPRPARADLRR
jgi:hypothetical protein